MSRLHTSSGYPARFGGPTWCTFCNNDYPCSGAIAERADADRLARIEEQLAALTPEAPDTAAHLAWLREDDRLARALFDCAVNVDRSRGVLDADATAAAIIHALEANR